MINYKKQYIYKDKLKTDDKSFTYNENDLSTISTSSYKIQYEYKYDKIGNWIKRIGKVNNDIIEIVTRELIYK